MFFSFFKTTIIVLHYKQQLIQLKFLVKLFVTYCSKHPV